MFLAGLVCYILIGISLYGIIRLEVRHAIHDSKEDTL